MEPFARLQRFSIEAGVGIELQSGTYEQQIFSRSIQQSHNCTISSWDTPQTDKRGLQPIQ